MCMYLKTFNYAYRLSGYHRSMFPWPESVFVSLLAPQLHKSLNISHYGDNIWGDLCPAADIYVYEP